MIIQPECLIEEVKITEGSMLDLHVVANNLTKIQNQVKFFQIIFYLGVCR